jgi:hypothetical protein
LIEGYRQVAIVIDVFGIVDVVGRALGPEFEQIGPGDKRFGRPNMGPSIAFVRIDLMEGGGCTEWIYIAVCGWRVIERD